MNRTFSLTQFLFSLILGIVFPGLAYGSSTAYTTYQAKIIKPDGNPLEAANVNFRFTILDPVGSCILYSENFNGINMSGSSGLAIFSLGSGIKSYPTSGSVSFSDVFNNQVSSLSCDAGVPNYNPAPNDLRKIVMQFHDGAGWQTLPAMNINHVPYAMFANNAASATLAADSLKLNGKTDLDFVQVTSVPTCGVSQALQFNGASFGCVNVSGGGGVAGLLSVSATAPLAISGPVSAPMISINVASMSSDGYLTAADYAEFKSKLSASATQITNSLGYEPVSGSAVSSQISTAVGGKSSTDISTSVDDTLSATSSNTANTIVKRDSSGNFTANDIYANSSKVNYVDLYKPSTSFHIRFQAPTSLGANYSLVFPNSAGVSGQILTTDGAGQLSWTSQATISSSDVLTALGYTPANAASAGVTTLNGSSSSTQSFANGTAGNAPAFVTAAGVHTLNIPLASAGATTAGLISNADYSLFSTVVSKITSSAASIAQVLGFTPADQAEVTTLSSTVGAVSTTASTALTTANTKITSSAASVTEVLGYVPADQSVVGVVSAAANTALSVANTKITSSAVSIEQVLGYLPVDPAVFSSFQATTAASFSAISGVGISTLNGSTSSTQAFANGTAGNAPGFITAAGVHTLNIPFASEGTTTAGLISNSDYSLFSTVVSKITSSAVSIAEVLGFTPADQAEVTTLSSTVGAVSTTANTALTTANTALTTANTKITSSAASIEEVLGYVPANAASVTAVSNNKITSSAASVAEVLGYVPADESVVDAVSTTANTKITSSAVSVAEVLGYVPADALAFSSFQATTAASFSAISGVGISTLNGSTSSTQAFANGTAGNAPAFITAAGLHTLNIPFASAGATTAGLISNSDYSLFSTVVSKITSSAASIAEVLGFTPADQAEVTTLSSTVGAVSTTANTALTTANTKITSSAVSIEQVLGYVPANAASVTAVSNNKITSSAASVAEVLGYVPADQFVVGAVSATANTALTTANTKITSSAVSIEQVLGYLPVDPGVFSSFQATTAASFSAISGVGISTLNGSTSSTQSFANGTSGNAPAFVTAAGVHTLNIPFASAGATTAGLISNADYSLFSTVVSKITSSAASISEVLGFTPADQASVTTLSSTVDAVSTTANTALTTANTKITSSAASIEEVLGYVPANAASVTAVSNNKITSSAVSVAEVLGYVPADQSVVGAVSTTANTALTTANTKITSSAVSIEQVLGYVPANAASVTAVSNNKITSSAASVAEVLGYVPADALAFSSFQATTAASFSAISGVGISTLNGSTSSTQAFANGIAGNAPAFVTAAGVHTLNIPFASAGATTAGLISNADYSLFSTVVSKITSSAASIAEVLGFTPADQDSVTTLSSTVGAVSTTANTALTTANTKITSSAVSIEQVLGYVPANAASVTAVSNNKITSSAVSVVEVLGYVPADQSVVGAVSTTANTALTTANTKITSSAVSIEQVLGYVPANAASVTAVSNNKITSSAVSVAEVLGYVPADALAFSSFQATTAASFSAISGVGISTLNGSTSSTQAFANGIAGNAPAFVTAAGVHTLNIPFASAGATTAGLISNADYSLFSTVVSKITSSAASIAQVLGFTPADQAIVGAVSATANTALTIANTKITSSAASIAQVLGYVPAASGAVGVGSLLATNNLSDLSSIASARTNLGLGGFATISSLDLGSASATGIIADARLPDSVNVTSGTQYTKVTVDGKGRVTSGANLSSADVTTALGYAPVSAAASSQWSTSGTTINYITGNVGIGTTTPGAKLQVVGSFIAGNNANIASATGATLLGENNTTSGSYSLAVGSYNTINSMGYGSVALGGFNSITQQYSVAMGDSNIVTAYSAGALGFGNIVTGQSSFAAGTESTTSGTNSMALGDHVTANSKSQISVGSYNLPKGGETTNAWVGTDPIFVVGNGASAGARSNAMMILKNGNVGIGTTTPITKLSVSGGVQISMESATCAVSYAGTLRYNSGSIELCNGSAWSSMSAGGGSTVSASTLSSTGNITLFPSSSVTVSATTASTNSNTGALVVNGGVGIAGNLFSSGTILTSANIQGASITATSGIIAPYIYGATTASQNILIDSTTHATKGNIIVAPDGGYVGVGTRNPAAKIDVVGGAVISRTNVISSGATVNLALGNNHLLKSVGTDTITLQNLVDGGAYTLVVSDTTARTYTFNGCTNTYFNPTNAETTAGSRSTYTFLVVVDGANTDCYISWMSGFQ